MTITSAESHAFIEEFKIPAFKAGLLSGLSFAVKDIIDVAGYKTGCGNPMWKKKQPVSITNAVCVDQLLYAGANCKGKTITSEFVFDLIGENSFFPTPLNPKAPNRVPGGSSSGSASAVACGLVDFAIGTDTGGSVRVPANNCGIFGFRPSHGIISVAGVMEFAPSFDTIGFFAGSLDILCKVAQVLLSFDEKSEQKPKTIYVVEEAFALADEEVKRALRSFTNEMKSISIHEIDHDPSVQQLKNWYETFVTIQFSEIWSCLGTRIESIELSEKGKISFGLAKNLDRSLLPQALAKREFFCKNLNALLGRQDLLCIPTSPALAPIKGSIGNDRSKGNYYPRLSSTNSIAGLGRLPQLSLPAAEVNGVPIGLSLLAAQGNDAFLIYAAKKLAVSIH